MMRVITTLAICIGKLIARASQVIKIGSGGTWPGEVALRLNLNILSSLTSRFKKGIILVAGTNGKTTTASMVQTILERKGYRVIHNASGANLMNGIVSACINASSWIGILDADWGVFEVDENALPGVISNISREAGSRFAGQFPISNGKQKAIIVLLNLFRDQLDRYGEVDVIAEKWHSALQDMPKDMILVVNADDPLIGHLALHAKQKVSYFGITDKTKFLQKIEHATDSTFCLNCGERLIYDGLYFSHLGIWKCLKCGEKRPTPDISDATPSLPGLYNLYNTLAAICVAKTLGINADLAGFHPAFGRQEEIGNVKIFLSKNPTGFNQSLRTVMELGAKNLLLVLNDRISDGRDVSWIWDVDFEMISKDVVVRVSGERVFDLALRLKYAGIKVQIYENLENALNTKETLYVLPTYSAMLDVRKILTGKKIL